MEQFDTVAPVEQILSLRMKQFSHSRFDRVAQKMKELSVKTLAGRVKINMLARCVQ